jgi:hypothetical protein
MVASRPEFDVTDLEIPTRLADEACLTFMETPCAWTFESLHFADAHAHKNTIAPGRSYGGCLTLLKIPCARPCSLFVKTGIHSACSTLEQAVWIQKRLFRGFLQISVSSID